MPDPHPSRHLRFLGRTASFQRIKRPDRQGEVWSVGKPQQQIASAWSDCVLYVWQLAGKTSNPSKRARAPTTTAVKLSACVILPDPYAAKEDVERVGWGSVQRDMPADAGRAPRRGHRLVVRRRHNSHLCRKGWERATVATAARPKALEVPFLLLRQVPFYVSCCGRRRGTPING